ncbi:hypothetical protein NP493_46g09040 [Ridgeia piscesae]|uniref:SSD domain-containing protein n=1 Tax=Ridgeia piscesae TaxID=27915 RepID=A0AAD9PC31_RIDPI|nr:hypothetical protein NP493_46g09040 [Ridgeia piscesae]
MHNFKADLPPELQNGFHLALGADTVSDYNRNIWHWIKVQKEIQRWALAGTFVGLSVSLPMCIMATGNVVLGVFATVNMLFILVTVVAVCPLAGLNIGVFESLNLMLIVGLSVNYAVMMTVGYRRSLAPDRLRRTHDALRKVGVSVVFGGLTSIVASFFLIFARLNVVAEFGVFTVTTIFCSTTYTLVLFSTLLGFVGPQDKTGDVAAMWRCFRR